MIINLRQIVTTNIPIYIDYEADEDVYYISYKYEITLEEINQIANNIKQYGIPYVAFVNCSGDDSEESFKRCFEHEFDSVVKAQDYVNKHGGNYFYHIQLLNKKYYVFNKPERFNNPRIYIASMLDVTNNNPHGVWIDCKDKSIESINAEIEDMLNESPTSKTTGKKATEYCIQSYEGFHLIILDEAMKIEDVVKLASGIVRGGLPYAIFHEFIGDDDFYNFSHSFLGSYESKESFIEYMLEELYINAELQNIPSPIADVTMESFVDIGKILFNLESSGYYYIHFHDSKYYIFHNF